MGISICISVLVWLYFVLVDCSLCTPILFKKEKSFYFKKYTRATDTFVSSPHWGQSFSLIYLLEVAADFGPDAVYLL